MTIHNRNFVREGSYVKKQGNTLNENLAAESWNRMDNLSERRKNQQDKFRV